jgi:hypothetical protein
MAGFHFARKTLVATSSSGDLEIVRLSAAGLTFFVAAVPSQRIEVSLLPGVGPLVAEIETVHADRSITARWIDVSLPTARDIARFVHGLIERGLGTRPADPVVEEETIDDRKRIRGLLHTLFGNRCSGRLHIPGKRMRSIRIAAGRLEPESEAPLQWECEEPWPAPPFVLTIDGYTSLIEFNVDRASEIDGFLAVPIPTRLRRVRSRSQRRIQTRGEVTLTFSHPSWPELHVRRRVRDVSLDGLQIVCSTIKDVIYPGMRIPEATVTWNDRMVTTVAAEVRHVADDIDGEAELAGLRLTFHDEHDRVHFREQVNALLHPNTRADGTWAQQLWDLYRASGYLELSQKSEPEFVMLKEAFSNASTRLARSDLGSQVVWPSSRGLEASLSILRCYERGSFIYQLARRQGRVPMRFPGRAILRDVYQHALEDLQRHAEIAWLIAWVQKAARFSRLVHVDMPQRYLTSGRVQIWQFHALEADVTGVAPSVVPPGVELAPASGGDLDRFLEHVHRTRTRHYIEAHDLSPDTFDQRRLREQWGEAGFHRGRQLWVARTGGRAVAYALLESADDGLHLFRLLDVVRLYTLEPDAGATFPALIDAARRWFAGQGKQRFICFAELSQVDALRGAGLHDLGEADAVLLPRQLLPELLEHVYEVTAPRDMPRLRGT